MTSRCLVSLLLAVGFVWSHLAPCALVLPIIPSNALLGGAIRWVSLLIGLVLVEALLAVAFVNIVVRFRLDGRQFLALVSCCFAFWVACFYLVPSLMGVSILVGGGMVCRDLLVAYPIVSHEHKRMRRAIHCAEGHVVGLASTTSLGIASIASIGVLLVGWLLGRPAQGWWAWVLGGVVSIVPMVVAVLGYQSFFRDRHLYDGISLSWGGRCSVILATLWHLRLVWVIAIVSELSLYLTPVFLPLATGYWR